MPTGGPSTVPISSCYVTILSNCSTGQLNPALNTCSPISISTLQDDGDSVRVTCRETRGGPRVRPRYRADGPAFQRAQVGFRSGGAVCQAIRNSRGDTVPNFLELTKTWHYGDPPWLAFTVRKHRKPALQSSLHTPNCESTTATPKLSSPNCNVGHAEDAGCAQLLHYMRSTGFHFPKCRRS